MYKYICRAYCGEDSNLFDCVVLLERVSNTKKHNKQILILAGMLELWRQACEARFTRRTFRRFRLLQSLAACLQGYSSKHYFSYQQQSRKSMEEGKEV